MAARDMKKIEINVHEKKLYCKLAIYKDYIKMHGQQDTKKVIWLSALRTGRLYHQEIFLVLISLRG
jgi:hypothetical protein